MTVLQPLTIEQFVEAVRANPRVLAVGGQTKPRLSAVDPDVRLLSTRALTGIVDYEPSEFTFTALAGTPVRTIAATLAERGQYLPFDPMLFDVGATLGGTVAAGLNGPGRFRFGGLRDFILGVRYVDGSGRLLRAGGKVVKNAAGFDLPKFFTGSLGRFGALVEVTFKVFPRPPATRTLRIPAENPTAISRLMIEAANTRWELDALDAVPSQKAVWMRLAGPESVLDALAVEILARWPGETLAPAAGEDFWTSVREFRWAHGRGSVVRIALTPKRIPDLCEAVAPFCDRRAGHLHLSAGGNVALAALSSPDDAIRLGEKLVALNLPAMALRGESPLWLGARSDAAIFAAVKSALDPQNRFPPLD